MTKEARVGSLVLAALVIAGAAIFLLGRQQHVWERKVEYAVHFARTNGLQRGAPVSLSGLPIGSVDGLRFATEPGARHIEVAVEVDAEAAARIRTDTRATIRTLGLLGDKYIELVPGDDPDADAIPAGGLIPSVDPVDYEALMGQSGGDIVANVAEVTAALRDVLQTIQRGEGLLGAMVTNREFGSRTLENLDNTMASLKATGASLDRIVGRIDAGEGALGRLVTDQKLAQSLEHSLLSLERVSRRLERGRGAAMRLVDDKEYADRVLSKLERTVDGLAQITDKLNRGQGTLGKLINESSLHDETQRLVRQVQRSWLVGGLFRGFGRSDESSPREEPQR
jgi:phospholipid/cholesterol/gamma-HCH transport system substrate-binding protein